MLGKRRLGLMGLVFLFGIASSLYAEEAKVPVIVNGDKVEYFQDEQKVVGTGNVSITYEDVKLTCDKMTVRLDAKEALAEGNVKFYHENSVCSGEKVSYNFDTKKGEVIKGKMEAPPWYGKGEKIEKAGISEYRIEKGYVTSCNYMPPHYRVESNEVKIFLGDKVVAKNCVMYAGNMPLLYMPCYTHSLRENKPGFTVTPGYDSEWGGFTLTKWRYYLNEDMKGYVHLDYREKKDFAGGVDCKYDTKYIGEGLLQTYYMNERAIHSDRIWEDRDLPTTERERYKAELRHRWLIDSDTNLNLEYHKFSDATFQKDYFYRDYEKEEAPPTYVSLLHQKPLYSAEVRMDKRANRYETVVEYLPEFSLDIGKNRFLDTNIYYKSENDIAGIDKKYGNDAEGDLNVFRVDTHDEVSYAAKLFDFLSVSPYIGTRQTYFSKDNWGEEDFMRGVFQTGIDTSIRFYRGFNYNTDTLGLDINGLRHVVNPVVKYYYNHKPTVLPGSLMQFDSLDSIDRRNGLRFELENKVQTKREYDKAMKTVDLARLLVATDYLFNPEQDGEFTDFDGELELRPYRWLYMESEATYDHLKSKIERGSWDLVAHDPTSANKWDMSIGQRYELERSSQLTTGAAYKISQEWQVRAYERFQFKENTLKEQEYSLLRDLHCWTAEFLYNNTESGGHSFWVILRIKALSGSPFKTSTSYYGPKTEAQRFYQK